MVAAHRHSQILSVRRVEALVLRHFYLLRGTPLRVLDLIYWPILDMVVWGYMNKFLQAGNCIAALASGVFLAAILLWQVTLRGQIGVLFTLMEEMWARNLGHLFVSPLTPGEFLFSMLLISLLRTIIGITPAIVLAAWMFDFQIWTIGLPLLGFLASLMVLGWWLGLVIAAMLLRYGLAAEGLAWLSAFIVAPVACIFYPVSVLPPWLQHVAWALPPVYVFEGLRALLAGHGLRLDLLAQGLALNFGYLAAACGLFLYALKVARQRGQLLQTGE